MLATDFIARWRSADLTERAAAQSHFRDLCDLLARSPLPSPTPKASGTPLKRVPPRRPAAKAGPNVWKRERFGWEYKSKGKDLRAAFAQLQRCAPALETRRY
jgi:hypothetical protein